MCITYHAENLASRPLPAAPELRPGHRPDAPVLGAHADYAIYFRFRLREELAHGSRLEHALGRALMTPGKVVLFVSSAIAFGYATLCLSGFGLHVQLGSLVALAMLVSSGAPSSCSPRSSRASGPPSCGVLSSSRAGSARSRE